MHHGKSNSGKSRCKFPFLTSSIDSHCDALRENKRTFRCIPVDVSAKVFVPAMGDALMTSDLFSFDASIGCEGTGSSEANLVVCLHGRQEEVFTRRRQPP